MMTTRLMIGIFMLRSHLSRWSVEILFIVLSVEEAWSPDTGFERRGEVTLNYIKY